MEEKEVTVIPRFSGLRFERASAGRVPVSGEEGEQTSGYPILLETCDIK